MWAVPRNKEAVDVGVLNIALVQMKSEKGQIEDNLCRTEDFIRQSKDCGTEIVCFREMSITGYFDPTKYPDRVLTLDSPAVRAFVELSRRYHICLIGGFVEHNPRGKPYITQIAAYDGVRLSVYRKINVAEDERMYFTSGSDLSPFYYKDIAIGLTVCADIDRESLFEAYAQGSVKLIFESAAPGLYGEQAERNWQSGYNWWRNECYSKLGKYAQKNHICIAVSTQAGRTVDEDFPGGGYVFSPRGECIKESVNGEESVLYAKINMD